MTSLNFNNPMGRQAQAAMSVTQRGVSRSGEAISTGNKSPVGNVVGYILGSSLRDNVAVLSSVLKSVEYGTSFLNVAITNLESMKSSLTEQLKIVNDSLTASTTQLPQLKARFDSLTWSIRNLAINTNFDGMALLDGTLNKNIRLGYNFTDGTNVTLANVKIENLFKNAAGAAVVDAAGAALATNITTAGGDSDFDFTGVTGYNAALVSANANGGAVQAAAVQGNSGIAAGAIGTQPVVTASAARAAAGNADAMIKRALTAVGSAIAAASGILENLQISSDSIAQNMISQTEASDNYLKTDYKEEIGNLINYINSLQASMLAMTKSAPISQALLQLLQNA